jgi:adenylate cyclase class 2
MRRHVYDIIDGDTSQWLRLRDTGDQITLTYKKIRHDGVDGVDEIETTVGDLSATNALLGHLGYHPKAYQENYRTSYRIATVQVEIDEWPRLDPYVEIEAGSIEEVHQVANQLGRNPNELTSINTQKIYANAGIDLCTISDLRFS